MVLFYWLVTALCLWRVLGTSMAVQWSRLFLSRGHRFEPWSGNEDLYMPCSQKKKKDTSSLLYVSCFFSVSLCLEPLFLFCFSAFLPYKSVIVLILSLLRLPWNCPRPRWKSSVMSLCDSLMFSFCFVWYNFSIRNPPLFFLSKWLSDYNFFIFLLFLMIFKTLLSWLCGSLLLCAGFP